MKDFVSGIKAFFNPLAWVLLVAGSLLLSSRVPASADLFVNLPELVTVLQLAGGLFVICGFGMIASQVFWPQVKMANLMAQVETGSVAAALVVLGLKLFSGLCVLGFAVWLAQTVTGLAGVHGG